MSDLKEDYKEKLDKFIIKVLNSYCHVEKPWDELKKITGNFYDDVISKKSVCPDLVIYNKKFNKNECFIPFVDKYNPFPRKTFYLRKKKLKNNSLQNGKGLIENDNKKNDGNYKINDFIINRNIYNNMLFRYYIINQLNKNNYKNVIKNHQDNSERIETINLDIIISNNNERRNWSIKDIETNGIINFFNNEQLYYFLNEIMKDKVKDFKYDFYIYDNCFDQYYYDIELVYKKLENNLNRN